MPSYLVHFNKNHDKLGRFTYGDGNGYGINADSYRTPEIDALYNKYSSLFKNAYAVDSYIDDRTESDKKLLEKITDMSAKALKNIGEYTEDEIKEYTFHDFDYDFFEYFYGYRTVAYLASKGYDKDQIKDIIEANAKIRKANYQFEKEYEKINPEPMVITSKQHAEWEDKRKNASPYPNNSAALFSYPHTYINADKDSSGYKHLDSFIDECIKLSKEMEHSDSSDYLVHFNPRHDPKTGRFDYALTGDKKKAYNGTGGGIISLKYMNDQYKGYKKENKGILRSRGMANNAAIFNRKFTRAYNENLRKNKKYVKKALKAYEKQNENKYNKYVDKIIQTYKDAKLSEKYIEQCYDLGKATYSTWDSSLESTYIVPYTQYQYIYI